MRVFGKKSSDQRRERRVAAIIVTELKSARTGASRGKGCLTDLSLGGLGFETEADFEKGAEVLLTFHMPVEVRGRIVHADKKGLLKRYGVRFTELGKGEKLQVERYVKVKFKK